jgi:hypothetical protein
MSGKIKSLVLLLCIGLAASRTAVAEEDVIKTRLLTLSLGGAVPGYFIRSGDQVAEIQATTKGIGAPTAYRGPGLLSLYATAADAARPKPGEAPAKPALQVRLPRGHDRILLVFAAPTEPGQAKPEVRGLGISTGTLKEGDYRIFNLSRQTVHAVLGGRKATIHPGQPVNLSSPSWRTDTMDMEVKLGLPDQDKLRLVYSSVWGHQPTRRMFLFILNRPDEFRPIELRRYFDTPSIGEPERNGSPTDPQGRNGANY